MIEFVAGNDHFFLNLSMASCKAMLDAAADVPHSSMVTVMARNGVNFGIRVSGTGDRWFQAPANPVDGLFFPGYGVADAAADLGDSAITETAGLGGFAMAARRRSCSSSAAPPPMPPRTAAGCAPSPSARTRRLLPALNFGPTPAGVDVRLVLDSGMLPIINTGIAHREAGVGQIGAGITTAPMDCFVGAMDALAAARSDSGG